MQVNSFYGGIILQLAFSFRPSLFVLHSTQQRLYYCEKMRDPLLAVVRMLPSQAFFSVIFRGILLSHATWCVVLPIFFLRCKASYWHDLIRGGVAGFPSLDGACSSVLFASRPILHDLLLHEDEQEVRRRPCTYLVLVVW